jgi:hypothetical protein
VEFNSRVLKALVQLATVKARPLYPGAASSSLRTHWRLLSNWAPPPPLLAPPPPPSAPLPPQNCTLALKFALIAAPTAATAPSMRADSPPPFMGTGVRPHLENKAPWHPYLAVDIGDGFPGALLCGIDLLLCRRYGSKGAATPSLYLCSVLLVRRPPPSPCHCLPLS